MSKTKEMTYSEEAEILMKCIGDNEALNHWLFEMDFFVQESGEPLPDAIIADYLIEAGASNQAIDKILKIAHSED